MPYDNETDLFHIPYPSSGQQSSVSEEQYRDKIPEWVMEALLRGLAGDDTDATISDGFAVSDNGGLSVSVAAGRGFLDGIPIHSSGATTKSGLTDDDTNYIYLKLTATSDRDRTFTVEASLSGPPQADSILIAIVTTSGGSITDIDNTPSGRAPRIPQTWGGIPQFRVVAPAGGDYTSPKTAIEACNGDDVVFICAGTYTLTVPIIVPANNIHVIGASRSGCILNNTAGSLVHVINLDGHDGFQIERLTIQTAAGNTGHGITGAGCTDIHIADVVFLTSAMANAISLSASSDRPHIHNCYFNGSFTYCVYLVACANARVERNIAVNSKGGTSRFISATDCDGLRVACNDVHHTGADSINSMYLINLDHAVIESNIVRFDDMGVCDGIFLRSLSDGVNAHSRICANIIVGEGDTGNGIRLYADAGQNLDETLISNNILIDFAIGVMLADVRCRETFIHGNKVATCTTGISDAGTNTNQQDQD